MIPSIETGTRRAFLGHAAWGVGGIALGALCSRELAASGALRGAARVAPRRARAKSVIYLHMAGSPSQLDLFDDKPLLRRHNGRDCPKELLEGKQFAFIRGVPKMLGSPFRFRRWGECGLELSELLPGLGEVADRVAVVRSVHTDQFNHAPAQLLLHTGAPRLGHASLGSWAAYGLGSENADLPAFVVLVSGSKQPSAGKSLWGSGFLPGIHQGVQCRSAGEPVLFVSNPAGIDRPRRRAMLDVVQRLNEGRLATLRDPEIETRIEQFELAFRMQVSVPDVMDISREPAETLDLYGARPGFVAASDRADDPRTAYRGDDATFANNCLLARRLVERGVRFVQVFDWGWDHHGSNPGETIDETLPIKCRQIDRAIRGLIVDLERRGLLEETLIVWGGEFGRTPMQQNNVAKPAGLGRDHHPHAFTLWFAGGGVQGGTSLGRTDELGYYPIEDPVSVRDVQATILSLLGFDPWSFSYRYQGLDERLIGPEGAARVLDEILV